MHTSWDDPSAFPVAGKLTSCFCPLTCLRKECWGMEHLELLSHALGPSRSKTFCFSLSLPRTFLEQQLSMCGEWHYSGAGCILLPFGNRISSMGSLQGLQCCPFLFHSTGNGQTQSLFWKLRTSHNLRVGHRLGGELSFALNNFCVLLLKNSWLLIWPQSSKHYIHFIPH